MRWYRMPHRGRNTGRGSLGPKKSSSVSIVYYRIRTGCCGRYDSSTDLFVGFASGSLSGDSEPDSSREGASSMDWGSDLGGCVEALRTLVGFTAALRCLVALG